MNSGAVPTWLKQAREHWRYRGQTRPEFAEQAGEGQESVWDYPRPPRVEADSREVLVTWGEQVIAHSHQALRVLETASPPTFYLPRADVRMSLLSPSTATSFCEWKGQASYWSLKPSTGGTLRNVAWHYPTPFPEFNAIAGHLAFYPAQLRCFVAGVRVRPQPGGLYGGWITPEVVGPIKGIPGSEAW